MQQLDPNQLTDFTAMLGDRATNIRGVKFNEAMNSQLSAQSTTIARLGAEMAVKDAELEIARATITGLVKELNARALEIERLKGEAIELGQKIGNLTEEVRSLEGENAELRNGTGESLVPRTKKSKKPDASEF